MTQSDDDEIKRQGEFLVRRIGDYIETKNFTPETLAANPDIKARTNQTAPSLAPAWPSYLMSPEWPADLPSRQYAPSTSGCGAVTTRTGSSASRTASPDEKKWALASYELTIPALDRPRTIRVTYGDGTHSDHSVHARLDGGEPVLVAISHWYPNAYNVEMDFGIQGPVNQDMELSASDIDGGGSHELVTFRYDAQPTGLGNVL